ncbi:MAG TPA: GH92 family glycosyl hydrolase [Tepidisphaeraceae bacterium]|jgi:predicted alpha-1,2-mannosidase|nr:GH92 family glycosyl hydrolase [Tepidisphaeraceae bacterium]
MSLIELVNPLQGTDSRHSFSTGNTYPAVGVPRGTVYWTPQTDDSGFLFDRQAVKLQGFRATRTPSPWMGDFGHFDVLPIVGAIAPTPAERASGYDARLSQAQPNVYRTRLLRYGVDVAMSATRSCGVFEFQFPADAGEQAGIVIQTGEAQHTAGAMEIRQHAGHTRVYGRSMSNSGGVTANFACYFVAEVRGADVVGVGTLSDAGLQEGSQSTTAPRAGAYLRLRTAGPVSLCIGTSLISFEQAELNLSREVGDRSVQDVAAATGQRWERWLNRVQVEGGSERDRRTLYSCLWHVGLFPMAGHEFDAQDRPVHYSPHTGKVEPGVFYTNNGFWDTYRTVYPLLGLIDRAGFGEIVDGYLQHYRQGGWLPKWCSPGYRDCMIGSHSDVVIADAVMHGIGGFDHAEAFDAIRKNAYEPIDGTHGRYGRAALKDYLELGYVPADASKYSVSWTLDNAHCDWAIAQVAAKLGRNEDAADLVQRSKNYRHLWHAGSGFMRPRNRDGSWQKPWSEFGWGGAYVEGGPWQHSFHVPHDPQGLAELSGGVDGLMARLQQMFDTPPRYEVGHYPQEIHEMTEMALAVDADGKSFGQYAHSNQPVHAFLYLPAQLGRPEISARWIERVMRGLYTPETLPADEDNGEMGAWYVLAALGQLPSPAGSGKYATVKTNVFDRVTANDR